MVLLLFSYWHLFSAPSCLKNEIPKSEKSLKNTEKLQASVYTDLCFLSFFDPFAGLPTNSTLQKHVKRALSSTQHCEMHAVPVCLEINKMQHNIFLVRAGKISNPCQVIYLFLLPRLGRFSFTFCLLDSSRIFPTVKLISLFTL